MPDAIIDGRGSGNTWGIDNQNRGFVNPIVGGNSDFPLEVAKGNITGYSQIFLSATNSSTNTSLQTIWEQGGIIVTKTVGAILNIVSTNVNDTNGGTGGQDILLDGVDGSGTEITETINLNGTTIVNSTLSFKAINAAFILNVGSSGTQLGDVSVTHTSDVIAFISTGEGFLRQLYYTVPTGSTAFVLDANVFPGKDDDFELDVRVLAGGITNWQILTTKLRGYEYYINFIQRAPAILAEGSILEVRVKKIGTGGTGVISAIYQLYEILNTEL